MRGGGRSAAGPAAAGRAPTQPLPERSSASEAARAALAEELVEQVIHRRLGHVVERDPATAQQAVAESTRCLMCNFNIWFDPFRCTLCGACADVCPEGVIHMVDIDRLRTEGTLPEIEDAYGWERGAAMVLDEERCIRCALCARRCPNQAITMERVDFSEVWS